MPIWQNVRSNSTRSSLTLQNIGTGGAGSVTAACFLARFTEQYKWAHLDVAKDRIPQRTKALPVVDRCWSSIPGSAVGLTRS